MSLTSHCHQDPSQLSLSLGCSSLFGLLLHLGLQCSGEGCLQLCILTCFPEARHVSPCLIHNMNTDSFQVHVAQASGSLAQPLLSISIYISHVASHLGLPSIPPLLSNALVNDATGPFTPKQKPRCRPVFSSRSAAVPGSSQVLWVSPPKCHSNLFSSGQLYIGIPSSAFSLLAYLVPFQTLF